MLRGLGGGGEWLLCAGVEEPDGRLCLLGHDAVAEGFELGAARQSGYVGDVAGGQALHPFDEGRG